MTGLLRASSAPDEIRDQADDRTVRSAPISRGHTGFSPGFHVRKRRIIIAAPCGVDGLLAYSIRADRVLGYGAGRQRRAVVFFAVAAFCVAFFALLFAGSVST